MSTLRVPYRWYYIPNIYTDKPQSCCGESSPSLSCFQSPTDTRCLDPIPLLTQTDKNQEPRRCSLSASCSPVSLCVWPRQGEQLLRISMRLSDSSPEEILLWSGPRREVWEQGVHALPDRKLLTLMLMSSPGGDVTTAVWVPAVIAADGYIHFLRVCKLWISPANVADKSVLQIPANGNAFSVPLQSLTFTLSRWNTTP